MSKASGSPYCNCVTTAKQITGWKLPRTGVAKNLKPTHYMPAIGDIVIENGPDPRGHLSVIINIDEDGFNVDEGNYKYCKRSTRKIKWGSKYLVGFWSKYRSENPIVQAPVPKQNVLVQYYFNASSSGYVFGTNNQEQPKFERYTFSYSRRRKHSFTHLV